MMAAVLLRPSLSSLQGVKEPNSWNSEQMCPNVPTAPFIVLQLAVDFGETVAV